MCILKNCPNSQPETALLMLLKSGQIFLLQVPRLRLSLSPYVMAVEPKEQRPRRVCYWRAALANHHRNMVNGVCLELALSGRSQ